ncbi:phage polarity suppression protein, partial [Escherichia coli]|uniref:phage polarity suppression protein n=1 Tax=Escherichia coli TaxID=562 RepID=UPI00292A3700
QLIETEATGAPQKHHLTLNQLVVCISREALSVHVTRGGNIDYAEEDRDILTTIGFRPDRASRDDNRAKYTPEQSQIFMRRQAAQTRKKSA